MKDRLLKRALPIVVMLCLCHCSLQKSQKETERYIVDSERQWAESVATGDTSAIERILADDFIGVDPQGHLYNKEQMIDETHNAPKYFVSNRLNDVKVRFYGNTAVAQGSETWQKHSGERGRFVWTDTCCGATAAGKSSQLRT
jgi:ketosteroid isomerase-like protein